MSLDMAKAYDSKEVEDRIYGFWLDGGWFHSEPDDSKEPFVVMMPLPNVTGILHTGHALNNTLQDLVIRFQRMRGKNAMWMPGEDHAGVATQIVVDRDLYKTEGKSRFDIGRDAFTKRVWEWKEKHGDIIINQLKKLGVSCDWDRFTFTMDEDYQIAVREAFCHYFEKGYIYQGDRVINWCPYCQTAISDIEVEHEDVNSHLWYVKYPFADNHEDGLIVVTTRPETMLGDTAVAVNPDDDRYTHLKGKQVTLPIVERDIPIIEDDYVGIEFGTGVVKITPAHDPNDFQVGKRHKLPMPIIMGPDGRLTDVPDRYKGLTMLEARKKIVSELEERELLVKIEDHKHSVGHHDKCKTTVEPLLSKQWFMKMDKLVKPAIDAVEKRKVEFIPDRWSKVYFDWMNNILDWCLSRQSWWGHRMPIYYCRDCEHVFVSREEPHVCPKCKSSTIRQEEDSLDTWFSSALWPFATLGWPKESKELEYYHPGAVLITGYDIIFYWVARMIFSSLEFMNDVPFKYTYMTGLIRDEKGRKMSKSLKNAIDPMEVIEKYGTDAMRFTLMFLSAQGGQDIKMGDTVLTDGRNFVNKLWNASRYTLMNLEDMQPGNPGDLSFIDRWIVSRLAETAKVVTDAFETYDIAKGARAMYDFFWTDFCDWYIELSKLPIRMGRVDKLRTQRVLYLCLETILKLLHPVIPFVTEEIWQKLPFRRGETIMTLDWPNVDSLPVDNQAVSEMDKIQSAIKTIRNLKAQLRIHQKVVTCLFNALNDTRELLTREKSQIKIMAKIDDFSFADEKPSGMVATASSDMKFFLDIEGEIDVKEELARVKSKIKKTQIEIDKLNSLLSRESFINSAPEAVIEKNKSKLYELNVQKDNLKELMKTLSV